MDDIEQRAFLEDVGAVMKALVSKSLEPITSRLDAHERQINATPAPKDGKDADEAAIETRVRDAVGADLTEIKAAIAAIPPAPDVAGMIAAAVAGFERQRADDAARIEALTVELKALKESIPALIRGEVERAVSLLPPAKDGVDGKSVTIDDISPLVDERVAQAVARIPVPQDGKDAPKPSHDEIVAAVRACPDAFADAVAAYLSENPPAAGRDGKDGERGEKGERGADGKDGRDGLDVKELLRVDGDRLLAIMSDGSTKDLGVCVGKDGADGKDGTHGRDGERGADGVGFDDMDLECTDRGVFLKFVRGDIEKRFPVPVVTDCGVFRQGDDYLKGNGVTWGGSFWIAQKDTNEKPGSGDGWRLAVKKGRDGKDADAHAKPDPKPIRVG